MSINNDFKTHGIAAASGYSLFSALQNPIYAQTFTKRLYAESVAGNITSESVVPPKLRQAGDLAVFKRPPRGQIFRYTKNQPLEVSHLSSEIHTIKVDKAWYWNVKLDEVDKRQVPEIVEFMREFQRASLKDLSIHIDRTLIHDMVLGASPHNKGASAGIRTRSYNLGKYGAPLTLTASGPINPFTLVATMRVVLGEQNVSGFDDMFVVFPLAAEPLLLTNSVMASAATSGQAKTSLITGEIPRTILGVKYYFTNNIPTYQEPNGETTYPVIMGSASATGYVTQLASSQVIEKDPRAFATYYRGLHLAGWGVIQPELLAVAYVKVQNIF